MIDNKITSLLFDNNKDIEKISIDLSGIQLGMSEFQIRNFVLNKKEFPTEFTQFRQAKMELYTRVQTFNDLYYQYRKANAKIKLSEAIIEDLENSNISQKMRDAKIELQEIEIEKNNLSIFNIKKQATEKLNEALTFYETYKKYQYFEKMSDEEISEHEIESWKIKSAYYPELLDRYGLTPNGFLQLPHENGGLKELIKNIKKENKLLK